MMTGAPRLLLVVPSTTSFHAFFAEVAVAWRDTVGHVAVAAAAELAGDVSSGWPDGIERLPLPSLRGGSVIGLAGAAIALDRHLRTWRPDLVHAHFTAAGLALSIVPRRARMCRCVTFHGLHASAPDRTRSRAAALAEPFVACRMDHTWVLNEEDEAFLRDRGLADRVSRLESCGVGCDLRRFYSRRFSAADREAVRSSLGIPSGAEVLAFIGRRTAFKGFHTAIRAFRLVQAARPAVRLLLVGTDDPLHPDGLDPAERRSLAANPAVIDVGWRRDLAPLLAITTAVVFPSEREGMPVNLMEALAMGVPVIASHTRGSRDIVEDAVSGVLVDSLTPAAFAAATERILVDPRLREAMSVTALQSRGRFDRRRYVEAQVRAYASFLPTK